MRTKEEILTEHGIEFDTESNRLFDGDISAALKAMDEYARQQGAAFAEWALENRWRMNFTNGRWITLNKEDEPEIETTELYTLFLQSTTHTDNKKQ